MERKMDVNLSVNMNINIERTPVSLPWSVNFGTTVGGRCTVYLDMDMSVNMSIKRTPGSSARTINVRLEQVMEMRNR
jgi:hypothetical protein